MPFPHRIEKRPSSARLGSRTGRGRGRPSDWSSSWQKKLIVLRLCGLQLNEILLLFNVLGDGIFKAKERRAQQLLRNTLCTGYARYCAPNKDALRKRIAFLRVLGHQDQLQRAKKRASRSSFLHAHAPHLDTERRFWDRSNPTVEILESPKTIVNGPEHNSLPTNTGVNLLGRRTLAPPWENSQALSMPRTSSTLNPIQENQLSNTPIPDDSRSVMSSRSARIRSILKRASYSSSLISDIRSVLHMRFSLSTLSSSSRGSVSVSSMMDSEGVRNLDPPEIKTGPILSAVLELHQSKALQANAALINMCCSKEPVCIHGYIKNAVMTHNARLRAEEHFNLERQTNRPIPDWILNKLYSCEDEAEKSMIQFKAFLSGCPIADGTLTPQDPRLHQINNPDIYGNTTLFFAARSGAPLEILCELLRHVSDVNAVNDDGQTFLFLLDLDGFSFKRCYCSALSHSSGFECFVRRLETRRFDFDHIDHNGRSFLSYLCTSTYFKGDWLICLAENDWKWKQRLKSLSWARDSSGLFLQDFLALNANNAGLSKYISEQSPPPYIPETIFGIDGKRITPFHEYIRGKEFLRTSSSLAELIHERVIPWVSKREINRYDELGYTPAMNFVNRVVERSLDEEAIVAKMRDLVAFGANINARARDGSTLLHIAAKRSYPELLQYLLSAGIQANGRDEAGLTALDYAAESLTRSRTLAASASLTARSFKAAVPLLDYAYERNARKSERALSVFETMARHPGVQTPIEACITSVAL